MNRRTFLPTLPALVLILLIVNSIAEIVIAKCGDLECGRGTPCDPVQHIEQGVCIHKVQEGASDECVTLAGDKVDLVKGVCHGGIDVKCCPSSQGGLPKFANFSCFSQYAVSALQVGALWSLPRSIKLGQIFVLRMSMTRPTLSLI